MKIGISPPFCLDLKFDFFGMKKVGRFFVILIFIVFILLPLSKNQKRTVISIGFVAKIFHNALMHRVDTCVY